MRSGRARAKGAGVTSPEVARQAIDPAALAALEALTPDELRELARALEPEDRLFLLDVVEGRTEATLTFRQYVDKVRPGYEWYPFNSKLARVLQDVADDLLFRVMVFMPPQIGKSELVSRLLPAYYLYRHPERTVALTTYGAELSYDLSRDARANFLEGGGTLTSSASAVKQWKTAIDGRAAGGGLWATGAGGPATGKGYNLGIIDDPLKDHAEAESEKIRKGRNDWYESVFYTRRRKGAAIVVCMTRWHSADLSGFLLSKEQTAPEHWHVVSFPALKEEPRPEDAKRWPPTVTLEPDIPRRVGESICEDRKPRADLERTRAALGGRNGYFWNALFQQRPVPRSGGLFKREYFQRIRRAELPKGIVWCRGWDLAATEDGGDATAGVLVGRAPDGRYYIGGLVHGHWHPGRRDFMIRATAKRDGWRVHQRGPQDPAQAGKTAAGFFVRLLEGFPVSVGPVSGDKILRATGAASWAWAGLYYIVDEPWAEVVLEELAEFGPAAKKDDITDAFTEAHNYLARMYGDDANPLGGVPGLPPGPGAGIMAGGTAPTVTAAPGTLSHPTIR